MWTLSITRERPLLPCSRSIPNRPTFTFFFLRSQINQIGYKFIILVDLANLRQFAKYFSRNSLRACVVHWKQQPTDRVGHVTFYCPSFQEWEIHLRCHARYFGTHTPEAPQLVTGYAEYMKPPGDLIYQGEGITDAEYHLQMCSPLIHTLIMLKDLLAMCK